MQVVIQTRQTTIFKSFLDAGADIHQIGSTGISCLELLIESRNEHLIDIWYEFARKKKSESNQTEIIEESNLFDSKFINEIQEQGSSKISEDIIEDQIIEEIIKRKENEIEIPELGNMNINEVIFGDQIIGQTIKRKQNELKILEKVYLLENRTVKFEE